MKTLTVYQRAPGSHEIRMIGQHPHISRELTAKEILSRFGIRERLKAGFNVFIWHERGLMRREIEEHASPEELSHALGKLVETYLYADIVAALAVHAAGVADFVKNDLENEANSTHWRKTTDVLAEAATSLREIWAKTLG